MDGKINYGVSNCSPEAPPLFLGSYYRSSNRMPDEASVTQTRNLRNIDEVGHRAKRVRHPVQAKTAIKGQVLAYFVMEFTSAKPAKHAQTETDFSIWKLSVDGAANS